MNELDTVHANRDKAFAEWDRANQVWIDTRSELDRVFAEWGKANTAHEKANKEYTKAYAKWDKTYDQSRVA